MNPGFLFETCQIRLRPQRLARCVAVVLSSVATPVSIAAGQDLGLDSLIVAEMESQRIPGLAAAVVESGRVTWIGTYGMADLETGTPVMPETMFQLASITKPLTATVVMSLYGSGLSLDDDISGYLPFPVRHPVHGDIPITVRQLLRHRSGIIDNQEFYAEWWGRAAGDPDVGLGEYLRRYLVPEGASYDAARNFSAMAPGEQFSYCNTCFALLAYVAERVSGTPFKQLSHEALFRPLGMDHTAWFLADIDTSGVAVPYRHDEEKGFVRHGHNGYPDWPAGQLRSSIEDVARFLAAYSNGGTLEGGGSAVIDSATQWILSPADFALGSHVWFLNAFPERRILYVHPGGDLGVRTFMAFDARSRMGLVVLTNGEPASLDGVIEGIYSAVRKQMEN